jgi:hypothetical protein
MSNTKYDHTSTIMSGSDWVRGRIVAYLFDGAVFVPTHKLLSEVRTGATQKNITEIQNRIVGDQGGLLGLPAQFTVTPKGTPYQMVIAWDLNQPEQQVLAFYDEDEAGGDIGLLNNGTLIVRPTDFDTATGRGTWLTL